jgi:hypothetical protein
MTPVLGPVEARLVLDLAGLPSLRLEHTLTRRVLAAIPTAHEHYRPCVGARSASETRQAHRQRGDSVSQWRHHRCIRRSRQRSGGGY